MCRLIPHRLHWSCV
uniref:Uncharacterized protein n=1 Tax=Anguilla anguilla TaxID=7936 RepID=A0A0E9P5C2_ANGAN